MPDKQNLQVQVQFGPQFGAGNLVIVLINCDITQMSDGSLQPAFKCTARQAMELGMDLISIAKRAEQGGE